MLNTFRGGLCAGVLVSIGGAVFLAVENKTAGAVLFTVALLCICFKGYYLLTGKVGYLAFSHTSADLRTLLTGLAGNLAITFALGLLIRSAMPALGEKAASICSSKLTQNAFSTLVRGFFCGMLMYLAVSTYKEKDTVLGILFCVPVFILSDLNIPSQICSTSEHREY